MQIVDCKIIAYPDSSISRSPAGYLAKLCHWMSAPFMKKPARDDSLEPRILPRLTLTDRTPPATSDPPDSIVVTGEAIPFATLLDNITLHYTISPALQADMVKLMSRNQRLFAPILDRLKTEVPDHYALPFSLTAETDSRWRVKGRSLFYTVCVDGCDFDLVFKNLNPMTAVNSISINPDFMFEPVQSGQVLRFGGNYQNAQSAVIKALAVTSVMEAAGVHPNTMLPVGLFKITDGMLATNPLADDVGVATKVDTYTYFQRRVRQMNPMEKINFLKFLLTDMAEYKQPDALLPLLTEAAQCIHVFPTQKNREYAQKYWPAITAQVEQHVDQLIEELLKSWTPVLLVYAVQGHGDERINWLSSDGHGHKTSTLATTSSILSVYGIEQGSPSDTLDERKKIALGFAQALTRIAYYHLVGGTFGSWLGSIHGKDITVSGAIMDLDAAQLPGTFSLPNAQINLTYAVVYTIPEFCWALGFDVDPIITQCKQLFKETYTQIIMDRQIQQRLRRYRTDEMSDDNYADYLSKLLKYIADMD